jgi:hypothetical protein
MCSHCSKNNWTHLIVRHNKFKKKEWTDAQTILLKCDEYRFFQQNGATAHTANNSMVTTCNNFEHQIINSLSYVACSVIQAKAM